MGKKKTKTGSPKEQLEKEKRIHKRNKVTRMTPIFIQLCEASNLPKPQTEHKFHKTRGWRIDFYFENENIKLALEVEGGVYQSGGHNSITGFLKDIEKYNALTEEGIFLYRCVPDDLLKMKTINDLKKILN